MTSLPKSSEIEFDGHFVWIDTLCCPVDAPNEKAVALALMRETYANAENVLVLDAELAMTDDAGMSALEIGARVVHFDWNKRLWTLQEAFFAKVVWIKLQTRAIDFDSLTVAFLSIRRTPSNAALSSEVMSSLVVIRDNARYCAKPFRSLIATLSMTAPGRLVSEVSDEAICLGSVLGLNMQRLAFSSSAGRMQQFWTLMSESPIDIPRRFIFRNRPGLLAKGFGWAPSTILTLDRESFLDNDGGLSELAAGGLKFTYPGFRLSTLSLAAGQNPGEMCTFLRDDQGAWYLLRLLDWRTSRGKLPDETSALEAARTKAESLLAQHMSGNCHDYAIILSRKVPASATAVHAILVKVLDSQDGVLFVKRLRPCTVQYTLDSTKTKLNEALFHYSGKMNGGKTDKQGDVNAAHRAVAGDGVFRDVFSPYDDPAGDLLQMVDVMLEKYRVISSRRLPTSQRWCME